MKRNVSLIMLIAVMLLAAAVSASAYTPRPGVLSPDEVDFGGKTVTIQIPRRGLGNSQRWKAAR